MDHSTVRTGFLLPGNVGYNVHQHQLSSTGNKQELEGKGGRGKRTIAVLYYFAEECIRNDKLA